MARYGFEKLLPPTKRQLQPVLDQLQAWGFEVSLAYNEHFKVWGISGYGCWWDFTGCHPPWNLDSLHDRMQAAKNLSED